MERGLGRGCFIFWPETCIIQMMKIHRFIGKIEDEEITRQIRKVLKLKVGERIILGDGKGHDSLLELTDVSREIKYKLIETLETKKLAKEVHLYLAILKKENFELAVQKAVECGVSSITPVITERTVKTGLNMERLEKIILEASEQCGQNILPTLSPILEFKNALIDAQKLEEKIIFHLVDQKYQPDKNAKSIGIFVGPEGGFTEKEVELAQASGFSVVSLGSLTLRGETAAIIATYRVVNGV